MQRIRIIVPLIAAMFFITAGTYALPVNANYQILRVNYNYGITYNIMDTNLKPAWNDNAGMGIDIQFNFGKNAFLGGHFSYASAIEGGLWYAAFHIDFGKMVMPETPLFIAQVGVGLGTFREGVYFAVPVTFGFEIPILNFGQSSLMLNALYNVNVSPSLIRSSIMFGLAVAWI